MSRSRRSLGATGGAAIVLLLSRVALAQLYFFEDVSAPDERSLHTTHAFYAYAEDEAPEAPLGPAVVRFHSLALKPINGGEWTDAQRTQLQGYQGVQVTLLRYAQFWDLIDPQMFCCTQLDERLGKCKMRDQLKLKVHDSDVLVVDETPVTHREVERFIHRRGHYKHQKVPKGHVDGRRLQHNKFKNASVYQSTVRLEKSDFHDDHLMTIHKSGVYILVLSNCGTLTDFTVSGAVSLRNPYGFLPGNEYYKMPFYNQMLLAYLVLLSLWGMSLFWWRAELFQVQHCISVVLGASLLDALMWYMMYSDWNLSGRRGSVAEVAAIVLRIFKRISSYLFMLAASYGWGVTRKQLDQSLKRRLALAAVAFLVADFIRMFFFEFPRQDMPVNGTFALAVCLPLLLLNVGMIIAISHALWRSIVSSRQQQDFDRLLFFQRLRGVLVVCFGAAAGSLAVQIMLMLETLTWRWRFQWFWSDGVPGLLFLVSHISLVYLWRPNKYSQLAGSREASAALLPMTREDEDWARIRTDDGVELGEGAPLRPLSVEQFLEPPSSEFVPASASLPPRSAQSPKSPVLVVPRLQVPKREQGPDPSASLEVFAISTPRLPDDQWSADEAEAAALSTVEDAVVTQLGSPSLGRPPVSAVTEADAAAVPTATEAVATAREADAAAVPTATEAVATAIEAEAAAEALAPAEVEAPAEEQPEVKAEAEAAAEALAPAELEAPAEAQPEVDAEVDAEAETAAETLAPAVVEAPAEAQPEEEAEVQQLPNGTGLALGPAEQGEAGIGTVIDVHTDSRDNAEAMDERVGETSSEGESF